MFFFDFSPAKFSIKNMLFYNMLSYIWSNFVSNKFNKTVRAAEVIARLQILMLDPVNGEKKLFCSLQYFSLELYFALIINFSEDKRQS